MTQRLQSGHLGVVEQVVNPACIESGLGFFVDWGRGISEVTMNAGTNIGIWM